VSARVLRDTWVIPVALAVLTIVGLVVALTGDGWRDAASWAALATVCGAVWWAMARRR
jgi:hypothetical protein